MSVMLPVPTLLVISGKPGSGKTTLGKALSQLLNLPHFNKDGIIEILFETIGIEPGETNLPKLRKATYALLSHVVCQAASPGVSVIVESNFDDGAHTSYLHNLAQKADLRLVQVHCHCNSVLAFARFKARADRGERHRLHPSRDTFEEYEAIFLAEKKLRLAIEPCIEVDTTDFTAVLPDQIVRAVCES